MPDNKPTNNPPDGHVTVRVLPIGHGLVHTGKETRPRIAPDEARDRLTGDARLKADADAFIAASIECGQTYAKGEQLALPVQIAERLESRGLVEIVDA
jgi:hypothetical protein